MKCKSLRAWLPGSLIALHLTSAWGVTYTDCALEWGYQVTMRSEVPVSSQALRFRGVNRARLGGPSPQTRLTLHPGPFDQEAGQWRSSPEGFVGSSPAPPNMEKGEDPQTPGWSLCPAQGMSPVTGPWRRRGTGSEPPSPTQRAGAPTAPPGGEVGRCTAALDRRVPRSGLHTSLPRTPLPGHGPGAPPRLAQAPGALLLPVKAGPAVHAGTPAAPSTQPARPLAPRRRRELLPLTLPLRGGQPRPGPGAWRGPPGRGPLGRGPRGDRVPCAWGMETEAVAPLGRSGRTAVGTLAAPPLAPRCAGRGSLWLEAKAEGRAGAERVATPARGALQAETGKKRRGAGGGAPRGGRGRRPVFP